MSAYHICYRVIGYTLADAFRPQPGWGLKVREIPASVIAKSELSDEEIVESARRAAPEGYLLVSVIYKSDNTKDRILFSDPVKFNKKETKVNTVTTVPFKAIKSEFILGAKAEFFTKNYDYDNMVSEVDYDRFLTDVQSSLVIGQREVLETDPTVRQLLPYSLIARDRPTGETEYLVYQRTKLVGEQRLSGLYSIGIGGHIDLARVCTNSPAGSIVDLKQTIKNSHAIEFNEELEVINHTQPTTGEIQESATSCLPEVEYTNQFLIHNEGVQAVHAGIVLLQKIPQHMTVCMKEDELKYIGFFTAAEIASSVFKMETWSAMYINYLLTGDRNTDTLSAATTA